MRKGMTSTVKGSRLCGVLTFRDRVNDTPGVGTRENKAMKNVGSRTVQ